jgi:hypothetical protein
VPAKKQEPGKPKDADAEAGEPVPAARLADALRDARVKVLAGFKVPRPRSVRAGSLLARHEACVLVLRARAGAEAKAFRASEAMERFVCKHLRCCGRD